MEPKLIRSLIWVLVLHLLASVLPMPTVVFVWCVLGGREANGKSDKPTPLKH